MMGAASIWSSGNLRQRRDQLGSEDLAHPLPGRSDDNGIIRCAAGRLLST